MDKKVKFSVLLSVYFKEKRENLRLALKSIYEDQILKPDEIILVEDGPLSEELYSISIISLKINIKNCKIRKKLCFRECITSRCTSL